ncbi:MAG: hydantoinase/oxoprolinase family protein [Alphaproteobacteria bacterium]|nr:hydantoinase/oxoprolinase family protein [Alphaproteobacteria bacterium]
MGLLVTIDNGGTLTDFCATDGERLIHTKSLTTPHDLSECLMSGLASVAEIFGEGDDLTRFISKIDYIRYSTTQGTNALVERKGPRLGWLTDEAALVSAVRGANGELFEAMVGGRVAITDPGADEQRLAKEISRLVSEGANRIVVGYAGKEAAEWERRTKRQLYRTFPRHLLGAVPLLFACELAPIGAPHRRVWSALLNAFLHPAMEQFLYNAENKLRAHRARNPLLVFRNDGNSTRVAKTIALKTYSSGPEGGIVGAQQIIRHYGIQRAVSIDIGGTTTDIAFFAEDRVDRDFFGEIEGSPVAIPMTRVMSVGAGGSSIFSVSGGALRVGPESVGSAPGPACFARGGTEATITDALLLEGVLDPTTYFGGKLRLDPARAERAIMSRVGEPLGLDLPGAIEAMKNAYERRIAKAVQTEGTLTPGTVLIAFGGAGPMSACGIAQTLGLRDVLIPRQAAVFSAYGIAFSDVQHSYRTKLDGRPVESAKADLLRQAERGMRAEGFALSDCTTHFMQLIEEGEACRAAPVSDAPKGKASSWLELTVVKAIPRITIPEGAPERRRDAESIGVRRGQKPLPLFELEAMRPGDGGDGACLIEERFFTTYVPQGWRFLIAASGDIFLTRTEDAR